MAPNETLNDDAEFSKAFAEEDAAPTEMSEDEAFGLSIKDEAPPAESAGVSIDPDDGQGSPAGEENAAVEAAEAEAAAAEGGPAEEVAEMPAEESAEVADGEPTDPKDVQRAKSWEGRLRARERELEAREAAAKGGATEPAQAEDVDVDGEGGEAREAATEFADAVASGDMTPEQAMQRMTEDFGPEFTKMIGVMISAEAGKAMKPMSGTVDQLISDIRDDKVRGHFEMISDAHPDFAEIGASKEFEDFKAQQGDKSAEIDRVIEGGTSREIVRMLGDFKKWAAKNAAPAAAAIEDPANTEAADNAEGVRSTGMRLPDAPTKSDDYESAWKQF